MTWSIVRADETRKTETPNGVMTTMASPTLSGCENLSLWQVAMPAGKAGPVHAFDREQVWTLISGKAEIVIGDGSVLVNGGDTIRIPAGVDRQVRAVTEVLFMVCGSGSAIVSAEGNPASGTTPPWIA